MSTPEANPGAGPQNDCTSSDSMQADAAQPTQMQEQTMPMPATSEADSAQTMPTQAMPQAPSQQFPQSADVVYQAMKNALLKSQGFMLVMADDVIKTANITSRNDGAAYMVQVMESPLGGSMVQLIPQGQVSANMQMESMVFFGELNRELMMQQMNAASQQNPAPQQNAGEQQTWAPRNMDNGGAAHAPKKPAAWVLYVAIGALALAVVALILLIMLTPKTGVWLVWVLGLVSLAFSGFSLYAALALSKDLIARILSGVAAAVSVLALVLGFVNVPKAASTATAVKPSATSSLSSPSSESSPSSSEETSESPSPTSSPSESATNEGTQSTDDIKAPGAAGEALSAIGKDVDSTISDVNNELHATFEKVGDTYASYNQNKQAIADWYAYVDGRMADLYQRIGENSGKFYTYIAQNMQNASSNEIDALMEEYQDYVYEDQFKDLEDYIYEDAFDEMNNKYYEGVLESSDDAKKAEDEDYSSWYDVRSECYENWYDARSEFYENWFDMRSDTYSAWLDINSEFFGKDFDIQKYVDRYLKKASSFKS